ncbi:MAG: glycosyltransferase [Candidatus Auribacterota bacterium]|nr:glycosyltransferase [Candidatus Auribacterota bacterium]
MSARTILILYISVGQGHRKAALAIRDALKGEDPFLKVVCLDLLEIWPGWVGSLFIGLYRMLLRVAPRLWNSAYDHRRVKEGLNRPLQFLSWISRRRVHLLLEELEPAAVVCTQAIPAILAADCKRSLNLNYSLIAVPTDFRAHRYWIDEQVDLYLLPSEESGIQLIGDGVDADRIRVTGIPVHPEFSRQFDPIALKEKYGFTNGLPVVLLMGGGEGTVSLERLILALDGRGERFQIAALSGRNLSRYAHLKRLHFRISHHFQVFGFIESVDELMAVADLIVTKPGGLTTAEALAKKLPMVLIDPLPGQEELNAEFLERNGAAIQASDEDAAATIVVNLLGDDKLRRRMVKSMEKIRKPDAARQAAKHIIWGIGNGEYGLEGT